jgi:hypothetical protein
MYVKLLENSAEKGVESLRCRSKVEVEEGRNCKQLPR